VATEILVFDFELFIIGASKKIFVATGILVFDFELFIGVRYRSLGQYWEHSSRNLTNMVSFTVVSQEPAIACKDL